MLHQFLKDPDVAKHCLLHMTKIKQYYRNGRPKPKEHCFVCKAFYIQCLLSDVDVENNSSNKTYTATTLSKEEIVKTINLCYSLLVSLPKTTIVIYRLCNGFLNSTRIHTNNTPLLHLQHVPLNLFQNF